MAQVLSFCNRAVSLDQTLCLVPLNSCALMVTAKLMVLDDHESVVDQDTFQEKWHYSRVLSIDCIPEKNRDYTEICERPRIIRPSNATFILTIYFYQISRCCHAMKDKTSILIQNTVTRTRP